MDKDGKLWRRALNIRRQAVAESETSSETEKEIQPLTKRNSNHCSCKFCHNCSMCRTELENPELTGLLRRKSSLLSSRSDSKVAIKNSTYKEKLETKIINDEMTEQLCYDKHNNSKKQIQDLSTLIRSFFSYVHSLDIRYKAAERLQQILLEIVSQRNPPKYKKEASLVSFCTKLKDVISICHKHIDIPSEYYESCNEYSEKYKDHAEAAFNFYYVLQEGEISHSQMRDYEMEYDRVRDRFTESKTSVASLLSNIIKQRSEALETCIGKLLPLVYEMIEQDKDIFSMLKTLSSENVTAEPEKTSKSFNRSSKSPRRKSDEIIGLKNARNLCCSENNVEDY